MIAETFIYQRLTAVAEITALVPPERIAPHPAPLAFEYPLITYQRTATGMFHVLSGAADYTAPRFLINTWSRDVAELHAIAELVRTAFDGYADRDSGIQSVQVTNDFVDFDDDEMCHRRTVEVVVWHDQ